MNGQQVVSDGWEHDATRHRATARHLARELHQLRADIAGHAATLAEWAAHIPPGRIPARARLALAELERLGNAPPRPPEPRTPPDDAALGSQDA